MVRKLIFMEIEDHQNLASTNVLGLISFAILIGICMRALQEDENVALVIRLVDGMNKLLTKAVRMIIWGWVS